MKYITGNIISLEADMEVEKEDILNVANDAEKQLCNHHEENLESSVIITVHKEVFLSWTNF